ncbi:biotin transporter BioY [Anianabacter salinae]|uniref:biotin transporter BioY n=1 Tax=Anianabacter salinae TaxID=2851023 RepID=UPI00225E2E93|nr:biotin transporter BioY [Anianabacter salinae]MBV0911471.1 biotin transporter BioY [Anianabacter salinae]
MTLTKALLPGLSLTQKAAMAVAGSLFIALAAQIAVPFYPVPMTLQTLAILIVGLTFGARLGGATLLLYLAEGAVGLPVFANGASTLAYMMGPTGGFLIGFAMMAVLAGLAVETGLARGFVRMAIAAVVVSLLLYVPGLAWPAALMGKTMPELWSGWMSPFLIGDAVKAVLAALVVTGGWAALGKRA